jgi:hypothetical protein
MNYYVQFGCGLSAPQGWLNFDASPSLLVSKIPFINKLLASKIPPFPKNVKFGNIIKGLPVENSSCRGLYASHILEHLSLTDFRTALINSYNLLQPGGVFRIIVPDLEYIINSYTTKQSELRSFEFMAEAHLGLEIRPRGLKGLLNSFFGNSLHLWMWDFASLNLELQQAGFVNVRRCVFNDCIDAKFIEVESKRRFENALAVECWKPAVK